MQPQTQPHTRASRRSKEPRAPSKVALKRAAKMQEFVEQLHARMAAEGRPVLAGPSDLDWDENGLER